MDGRGNRGGRNAYGANNWSDEEGDDMVFKRRAGGNRFRDEPRGDERNHRGARRGGAGDWGHQRGERRDFGGNRRNSRNQDDEKQKEVNSPGMNEPKAQNNSCDTEDDWDRELEEYDTRMETAGIVNSNQNNLFEMNEPEPQNLETANIDKIATTNTNDVPPDTPIMDEFPQTIAILPQEIFENQQQDFENTANTQPTYEKEVIFENVNVAALATAPPVEAETAQE